MDKEGVSDKWQLSKIGETVWLTKLDGDEPLIYYYHATFKNFVRAPIYQGPPPTERPGPSRARKRSRQRRSS
jgi:hypothetical protein